MTTAIIEDIDGNPISDAYKIAREDFTEVEQEAERLADSGKKCCIRWTRSSDEQMGYWGPTGAMFSPHWYAKIGRPSEMAGGRAVKVYLDAESIAIANRLGEGNVSDGIRQALKIAAEKAP
jgi:hypothetical protein